MKKFAKKVVASLLVATMAISFTACTKNTTEPTDTTATESGSSEESAEGNDTGATGEQVKIRFNWWGGDTRHEATLKAIEAFEAKYPNIDVEAEYEGWTGHAEKIATQITGNAEADLLQINWNWIYQFSPEGDRFLDLNTIADEVGVSNYPEDLLNSMTINGKLQGLPVGTTGRVFYWNKSTFDKAGIAVPTSIAELIAAGETFKTVLGDDYYPIALGEYDRTILMMYYLEQTYGKPWIADGVVNYSEAEVKEGLDWITMLEEYHVTPTLATIAGDGADSLDKNPRWMDGFYAGIYEWDSSASKFESALAEGNELVIGEFPTDLGPNKSGFCKISMGFAISANTKYPKETALLLQFLTSDPEGVEILSTERGMVSNTAAEAVLVEKGLLAGMTYEANTKVMDFKGFDVDPNFEHSELKDPTGLYYKVFQNLSYGQTDTTVAAQELISGVNAVNAAQ